MAITSALTFQSTAVDGAIPLSRATARQQADASATAEHSGAAGCTCGGIGCSYCDSLTRATDRVELSPQAQSAQGELNEEEQTEVEQLEKRDREVRRHEEAHLAAAGQYAVGGAHYSTETGPDGKQYAVDGHVRIDTSPVPNDPDATINKMETVKRAALAPAQPSAEDRRVASDAEAKLREARSQKLDEQFASARGTKSESRLVATPKADPSIEIEPPVESDAGPADAPKRLDMHA